MMAPGFRRLWLASVALPVVTLMAAGWWSWDGVARSEMDQATHTAWMLEEHALRAMETQEAVMTALETYVTGMSWAQIAADHAVYDFTRRIVAASPTVETLGLASPDGHVAVASESASVPASVSLIDRDYFNAFPAGSTHNATFVGSAIISRVDGRIQVHLSRPRLDQQGIADGGVIASAFSPAGFERFYGDVAETPATGFALVRDDGEILARYPDLVTGHDAPEASDSPTLKAARALPAGGGAAQGQILRTGSLLDGFHLTAVRRVGPYPVFIEYRRDPLIVRDAWLRQMAFPTLGASVAMALLLLLTAKAQGRMVREQQRLLSRTNSAEAGEALAQERAGLESRLRQTEKVAALGQLAAGVAHDFSNVLQGIIASTELLQSHLDMSDEAHRATRLIRMASDRGMELTRRMLDFARRDDGPDVRDDPKMPAPAITDGTDVDMALRNASELLGRTLSPLYHVELSLPDNRIALVRGSQAELETVIINLVVNARDALPGGGTIAVSAEEGAVPIDSTLPDGRYVRVSVADSGIGMDSTTLGRAGEAFFTTKRRGEGTGLGLSMARGYAGRVGGTLHLNSRQGEGTTVTLWLPAA